MQIADSKKDNTVVKFSKKNRCSRFAISAMLFIARVITFSTLIYFSLGLKFLDYPMIGVLFYVLVEIFLSGIRDMLKDKKYASYAQNFSAYLRLHVLKIRLAPVILITSELAISNLSYLAVDNPFFSKLISLVLTVPLTIGYLVYAASFMFSFLELLVVFSFFVWGSFYLLKRRAKKSAENTL